MCDGAKMAILGDFLRPVVSASRLQHVSDLHPKFALRPRHVWKYTIGPTAYNILFLKQLNVGLQFCDPKLLDVNLKNCKNKF